MRRTHLEGCPKVTGCEVEEIRGACCGLIIYTIATCGNIDGNQNAMEIRKM